VAPLAHLPGGSFLEAGISLLQRILRWSGRVGLGRKATVVLAIAALASGVATYAAMTGAPPFGPNGGNVLLLLNIDLVLLLLLAAIVAKRLVEVWVQRRRGLAGSRLHVRLVVLFSLVAVTPTIIVAVFSYLFFSFGIEAWFSERVRTALLESQAVAEAYLHEHQQVIRADVLAMASDLNREAYTLNFNPQRLAQVVRTQAALRSLNEAEIFDSSGRILARSGVSLSLEFGLIPPWAMQVARSGDVAIVTGDNDDRVRALVRLDEYPGAYLYIGRFVEAQVLNHMEQTQRAVAQYEQLEGQRSGFQVTFALVFLIIALLFLLAAVWFGINFATQMVEPIGMLIAAAERVRGGDLAARVLEGRGDEEFASLSRAFNRMTTQLQNQQSELIEANHQLDQRSRFTETVLAGVSAGVIGLDQIGRLNLTNRSASLLLATELDHFIGQELSDVVPEMAELYDTASRRPDRLAQSQIEIIRRGRSHVLLARIAAEQEEGEVKGYVVTFDEVTELLSAQRKAAWADVARRIAHEIKNPLTPIQLSAERLKRKYLREIRSDPETFSICTDTIIRHVEDIGRMVDEFSSFARMPAPTIKRENLLEICRQAVFLQRNAQTDIDFEIVAPDPALAVACDARLVGQASTNLLKNAVESIQGRSGAEGELPRGHIVVRIQAEEGHAVVAVEDNGKGLPQHERERLTEPYVTTRAKGTGLGLAIVKKIMEEHGGELVLEDRPGGAIVKLLFPLVESRTAQPAADDEPAANDRVTVEGD
jgi:two-component system, NtrC family, nitrogen regulation sensor histidine kinase NtrY